MNYFILTSLILLSTTQVIASDAAITIMEKGLSAHEGLTDFITTHSCELGVNKKCDRPLSSADIQKLKQLLRSLEEWRRLSFEGIAPLATLTVDSPHQVKLGETLSFNETIRYNPNSRDGERFLLITINPHEEKSKVFLQNARAGLATTLLLYDSYFRLAVAMKHATKLRSIIQYDFPEEGQFLSKTYSLASDKALWNKTVQAVKFNVSTRNFSSSHNGEEEDYFERYIVQSFVANQMAQDEKNYRLKKALFMRRQNGQGKFFEGINRFVGVLSKLFGNNAGKVQTRDGKLKILTKEPAELERIKAKLRPLDILLEKTPMRLTDKFIPGFYGHVAIWLGQESELSRLQVRHHCNPIPLLNHPDVTPHLEKLSQGKLILEALRQPGVTINTLEHFMDIDDLVLLKAPEMNEELMAQLLLRAFQQIGKPYDFNFDVNTEREIVCSELVFTVYTNMTWPTTRTLGRYTINPDQVAWKAVDDCYDPVLMFHDGKAIKQNLKRELRRLLELPGGISYTPRGQCF